MADLPTPTPEWLHGLWAGVGALFWKLWAGQDRRIHALEAEVSAVKTSVTTHDVLHKTTAEAISGLRESMKECADESRKQSEALVRIETILQTAVKTKE